MEIKEIYKGIKEDPEVLNCNINLVIDTVLAASNIALIDKNTRSKLQNACLNHHYCKEGKYTMEFLEALVRSELTEMGIRTQTVKNRNNFHENRGGAYGNR